MIASAYTYGRWLQFSVFQCRLTPRRRAALGARLDGIIKPSEDHVLIIDLGPADAVDPRVESLGRPFENIKREAVVVDARGACKLWTCRVPRERSGTRGIPEPARMSSDR